MESAETPQRRRRLPLLGPEHQSRKRGDLLWQISCLALMLPSPELSSVVAGAASQSIGYSMIPMTSPTNIARSSLSSQLEDVIFIAAALDCSTKSRAREIPRRFEDGRPAPGPLRSEVYPDGLPGLSKRDEARVQRDNAACAYVLGELQKLHDQRWG